MQSLGCTQYVQNISAFENSTNVNAVVQGGDFGCLITRFIASKYGSKYCKVHHINSAIPAEPTATSHPKLYAKIKGISFTPGDLAGLGRTVYFSKEGNGYLR
jgi:hypothetical protein